MRYGLRIGISIGIVLGLSACTASYRYTLHDPETGADCTVKLDSRRDIAGPAEFRIGKGCTVTVKAAGLVGGQLSAADMIGLIGAGAALARGQVPAVPAPQPQEFTTEDLGP